MKKVDAVVLPRLLRPLQRRTTGGTFLPVIDGLRFYAITAVVMWHTRYNLVTADLMPEVSQGLAWLPWLMDLGPFGVELFFVISGFILGLPFARQDLAGGRPVRLRAYYLRRLTRLEPPYLLSLLVMFSVRTWLMGVSGLWPHLLASSLYMHNLVFGQPSMVSAVTWSLEVEVQFYVLAPLIALPFRISSRAARRLTWLGCMALVALMRPYTEIENTAYLLPYLDYFLAGFLLADVYTDSWDSGRSFTRSFVWDAAASVCWGLLAVWLSSSLRDGHPALAITVFALYYSILRSRIWYAITTNPWIHTIGGMCYTLYLYHNLVLRALIERTPLASGTLDLLGPDLGLVVVSLLLYALVLVPGVALFVLVERPCMWPDWPARARSWLVRYLLPSRR